MEEIEYTIDPGTGGDPIEEIKIQEQLFVDDVNILPTLTIDYTDPHLGAVQFLCWRYVQKGVEVWKICRIRSNTRTVVLFQGADHPSRTITEKIVEFPNGYASYNFRIADVFQYSYLPRR